MQYKEVLELMQLFNGLSVDELVWESETGRLELRKKGTVQPAQAPQPQVLPPAETPTPTPQETPDIPERAPAANESYVTAPLVGVFYLQAAPGKPPFVQVGDTVQKGQTLCIIEAMKMMNEITAEIDGVIEEVLGENGKMVEFGQNLFKIRAV